MDYFDVLQKTHSLDNKDIKILKSKFSSVNPVNNNLFIGQLFPELNYNMIIGAPCIRKDIEGISLNTFYQIFMPMYVAKQQNLPCAIFLGIQEEIIIQPKLEQAYKDIGTKLEQVIKKLSHDMDIATSIINTSDPHFNTIIKEELSQLQILLTTDESAQLFNLCNTTDSNRKIHSRSRAITSKRVITCNTQFLLNRLIGNHKFLITEDIEQYKCLLAANKVSKNYSKTYPNFLGFLPLPSIDGSSSMFKANRKNRIIINDKEIYYRSAITNAPYWIKDVYLALFSLMNNETKINNTTDSVLVSQMIKKVKTYFS